MITTKISQLPSPPDLENPIDFDKQADAFVRSLNPFGKELNSLSKEINELSEFISQKSDELVSFINLKLEEIDLEANEEKLKLLKYAKELEQALFLHTQNKTEELLSLIDEKGF